MEQEFIQNQELRKPREEQNDVNTFTEFSCSICLISNIIINKFNYQSERAKVEDLRGTPMTVGTLEEIIDDNHAIISSSNGPEYYVTIMSFVNQDLLEVGSSVLLHNKVISHPVRLKYLNCQLNVTTTVYCYNIQVSSVVGILPDDADPMVSVMKVDKAPLESYADIGGLESQVSSDCVVFLPAVLYYCIRSVLRL